MRDGIRFTQVILTQAEWTVLWRLARRESITVTKFVRNLVLRAVREEEKRRAREQNP
jgi:predicted DNA-binding ribbon-helix-helix protein